MLRYCAWCGQFQGPVSGRGHQIRKNVCEVDTSTICPSCFARVIKDLPDGSPTPNELRQPLPSLG